MRNPLPHTFDLPCETARAPHYNALFQIEHVLELGNVVGRQRVVIDALLEPLDNLFVLVVDRVVIEGLEVFDVILVEIDDERVAKAGDADS